APLLGPAGLGSQGSAGHRGAAHDLGAGSVSARDDVLGRECARQLPPSPAAPQGAMKRARAIPMIRAMSTTKPPFPFPLFLLALPACHIMPGAPEQVAPITLVPEVMGDHLAVSTRSREAQSFFDQGLSLYWGFDHEEAQRSFARAAEFDPNLALAY